MSKNRYVTKKKKERHKEAGFITKASARYCDKFPLRAAIQGIPGLGSSLDTMLAGLGAKYRYERLEDFIFKLDERIKQVEQSGHLTSVEPSEPLFDLMMQVFDQVIRARSEEKRKYFANLVAKQVVEKANWEEAETACRLLGDLSDVHIQIVDLSLKAGYRKPPFENIVKVDKDLCPVTIFDKWANDQYASRRAIDLRPHLRSLPQSALLVICSELVANGLFRDRGLDYADRRPMEVFVATDLAKWLMDWISEIGEKSVSQRSEKG